MPFYLGIDMGTSSIKATLADEHGNIVMRENAPSSVLNPKEGFFEVEPEETWWNGFLNICRKITAKTGVYEISSVCITSVCGSFLPVGRNFVPLHNAILYGIDVRSSSIVDELNSKYGSDFLIENIGGKFTTHSILPKILWLKRELPEIYEKTAYFVSSFNFISSRLTGKPAWDYPTAFGALLLDKTKNYPAYIFENEGLSLSKMPDIVSPLAVLGTVGQEMSRLTGLAEGTKVVSGACDINAEAMAVGAITPNTAVAVFGSTVSLLMNSDRFVKVEGFVQGLSLLPDVWRIGAATSSGGRSIDWSKKLGEASFSASPSEILFLPYLNGARTPFNNPEFTGTFLGLKERHTPSDMALAVYESLGYELNLLISMIESKCKFPDTIEVSGGLSNILELMQIISDITGRTLKIHSSDSSYGSARMAMAADIPIKKLTNVNSCSAIIRPSKKKKLYVGLKERFIKYAHGQFFNNDESKR